MARGVVDAVCDRPVYPVRGSEEMPHATRIATCTSRVKLGGDVDYLMIAYYPSDQLMQADLRDRGYTYYWSGSRWDKPFVIATVSETTVIGASGLPVASSLEPLERFDGTWSGFRRIREEGLVSIVCPWAMVATVTTTACSNWGVERTLGVRASKGGE